MGIYGLENELVTVYVLRLYVCVTIYVYLCGSAYLDADVCVNLSICVSVYL